jgi:DNA-directed RNA polymerase beta subunit
MQREKLHLDSDGYTQYICETCGTQDVIVNTHREYYRCDVCQENTNIVAVPSCWSNNVFYKEVEAMGVGMRFNIKPTTYFV